MTYKIPSWIFVGVGGGAAAAAVANKRHRAAYAIGGGIAMAGMAIWNLYVETRMIESVVAQGQIYSNPQESGVFPAAVM